MNYYYYYYLFTANRSNEKLVWLIGVRLLKLQLLARLLLSFDRLRRSIDIERVLSLNNGRYIFYNWFSSIASRYIREQSVIDDCLVIIDR